MSADLRELGSTLRFDTSDSSSVRDRVPRAGKQTPARAKVFLRQLRCTRTGSNNQNTYRVREADLNSMDQASSLLKADGARSMTPKRSRQRGYDYFRVRRSVS